MHSVLRIEKKFSAKALSYGLPRLYNQRFTEGKTFRDWLNGKSYDEQYKYGMQVWKTEMKKAGYSIN